MMRLVSRRLTKIINIPNVKDHGATGATGCLKNIAYGSFSNVARTHMKGKSHTFSFVGQLAAVEPLRSRTVLQIMDGLRGVWHGGPFARTKRYVFYPKRIFFGTDPVAIDRLLLDIIDEKRKAEGALSIWDRSPCLAQRRRPRAGSRPERQHPHSRAGARGVRRVARARRRDLAKIRVHDHPGMTALLWLVLLPCLYWTAGPESAPTLKAAGIDRVCVPAQEVERWQGVGVTVTPLTAERARRAADAADAGHRAARGRSPRRRARHGCSTTAGGSAARPGPRTSTRPRKAAESSRSRRRRCTGSTPWSTLAPADLAPGRVRCSAFLSQVPVLDLPDIADFGVVDDGTPVTGEVLNLLVRRNLLFSVVSRRDRRYPMTVRLGTKEYPREKAADPSRFALAVRRQLTDERRSLRVYGSEVVVARLTGDAGRRRLHLLNYGGRAIDGLRIRVRGQWRTGEGTCPAPARRRSPSTSCSTMRRSSHCPRCGTTRSSICGDREMGSEEWGGRSGTVFSSATHCRN